MSQEILGVKDRSYERKRRNPLQRALTGPNVPGTDPIIDGVKGEFMALWHFFIT